MTWTYEVSELETTELFKVRFLTGDTDSTDPQLQDEEINFAIAEIGDRYGAAVICCRAIATKISRQADQTSGQSSVAYSQRAKAYARRAMELEAELLARGGAVPYVGGISIGDLQSNEQDTDRVPPNFQIGMDDDLFLGSSDLEKRDLSNPLVE